MLARELSLGSRLLVVSGSSNMKMSLQLPAIVRLENAAKTTVYHWCEEVGRIVEEYGVKELQSVLPLLTDTLFELHAQSGWSLRTLTKANNPRDFHTVAHLLSPRGPVINLCYKLLGDSTIKYEFPLSYIPAAIRHLLEEGVVPSFYVGKLQYHPHVRVPSSLVLNAFEYYMMNFLYYLVNPNLQKYATTSCGSDSVYFAILEDYLQYFLPCNGCDPEMIPVPSQMSYGSTSYATPPKSRYETSTRQMTPSLLKKSSLTPSSSGAGTSSLAAERTSHHDAWRTMMILQAINELWLSHVTTKENSNLQAGSPARSQINVLQAVVFLPSLDHLRAVRVLVKHLHYFANSMGPNIISGMDELKRTVWTYFQKKLYVFLRHTVEHWPLDASFRLFLETWLSYIQPWRYVSNAHRSNDGDKVVDWKWQTFVAENLLFYTLFLQKVILRFLRVELSSPKNSLMLYRISKVYSQRNLKEMISIAERSLSDSLSPSKSGISPHIAVNVRQYINDLENPSFNYVPLFGQETTLQIRTILACSARVKSNLRQSIQPEKLGKKRGLLTWLSDWFMLSGSSSSDENGEDLKKALIHLEQSSSQLAALFEVEIPSEPEPDSVLQMSYGSPSIFRTPVRGLQNSTSDTSLLASPLSPQKRYDLTYRGNPDTQPIRSYEIAFLVRMFHQICSNINDKFGPELEQSYERHDFLGRVVRQLLTPPIMYQEVIKKYGTPKVIQKRLGPRLCLRKLASQQVVGYTLGILVLSYSFGFAPEILCLLLVSCACAVIFVRASYETWRESGGRVCIDAAETEAD
ncbi:sphingomyelin phosphodiesterase 4-like [Daphnia carinata]|uniref:sphingomyelin phosphodiesterase 4-like n=1 Tax=Daphnia carinata TaxID=120202 RepID=UPI0025797911|nr:sphingomyelin phosphodiesterase 4-like [Daphnia carinata]